MDVEANACLFSIGIFTRRLQYGRSQTEKSHEPTELPLTLKLVESKKPADAFINNATYVMTGQTDQPLYLTGIEHFASGKQKIWFSETIKPGQYDGKSLKLSQQFDSTKGYRSYRYELDDTMNE